MVLQGIQEEKKWKSRSQLSSYIENIVRLQGIQQLKIKVKVTLSLQYWEYDGLAQDPINDVKGQVHT